MQVEAVKIIDEEIQEHKTKTAELTKNIDMLEKINMSIQKVMKRRAIAANKKAQSFKR